MKPPLSVHNCFSGRMACLLSLILAVAPAAFSSTCTSFSPGIGLGTVDFTTLKEASGLAASARNAGVLWTHNDGSGKKVFALNTDARLLARFDTGTNVDDVEDIAVGPGPAAGVNYIYLADTGGAGQATEVRSQVRIVRIPEPAVSATAPAAPPSTDFTGVESFLLAYPDGASFDAETLLLDPVTSDVLILTKEKPVCRLYRANLNAAANGASVPLTFVMSVAFSEPSGGDIAMDGSQIALRNENAAMIWNRAAGESVETALARAGVSIPVIGTPTEPNGEAIALMRDGSGYMTVSEEESPILYFFESQCPRPPSIVSPLSDQSVSAGGTATFSAQISGSPAPAYSWKFNGTPIDGQTGSTLTLTAVTAASAGTYELTAVNDQGNISTSAVLTIGGAAALRVTEIMAQAGPGNANSADWWELSSFDTQPVSLAGWKFNDDGGGLATAFTLPAGLSIAPGESIIFVEELTAAQFRAWWGEAAIPSSVQIVTYSGSGLAFSANGDGLRLWNATAAGDADTVASIDFGNATEGVTFTYDPATQQFGSLSQLGKNGAFKAAGTATDIGSPGLYRTAAAVPDVTIAPIPAGIRIGFTTVAGQTYELQVCDDLGTEPWSPTGDVFTAPDNNGGFFDKPVSATRRFYRIGVK